MEAEKIDYVLDANVIMSIVISGKAQHRLLLSNLNCLTIDFVFNEIAKHKIVIQEKAKRSDEGLRQFIFTVFSTLTVVPSMAISDGDWHDAVELCRNVDPKDVAYVALSLSTGFPLVTRDKPLHAGLRKKGFRSVLLFDEFLASL